MGPSYDFQSKSSLRDFLMSLVPRCRDKSHYREIRLILITLFISVRGKEAQT
jgi:hypothetical protein